MSPRAHATPERRFRRRAARSLVFLLLLVAGCYNPRDIVHTVVPGQTTFDIRTPEQIQTAPMPVMAAPATVTDPKTDGAKMDLSLDEAIRIALTNAKVVRVLAGATVTSSGKTIYDPAVTNTTIDSARSVFDPVFTAKNIYTEQNSLAGNFNPFNPSFAGILPSSTNSNLVDLNISKKLVTGGVLAFDSSQVSSVFPSGFVALNPQYSQAMTLSFTQPLLQGAGVRANLAPIVVARINTELSYFQLKDSVQEMARGVIEAYWNVVFARTDAWARRIQVEQAEHAYIREQARFKAEFGTAGSVAQTKVALSQFKANLVLSEANLLQREGALRNILGLPPTEPDRVMPTTPPKDDPFQPNWDEITKLAGEMRPDLIELALILEADQQNIILARNQAQPKLDATTFYRWNGLEGNTVPFGTHIGSTSNDWSAGVNFSVPLGLRDARAKLRNAELVLITDRANLNQGLHSAMHTLAGNVRNVAQYYEQYRAYKEMRAAAKTNLEQQAAEFTKRGALFLNLLQAITDWGNAVSFEAQALAQYNIELANLERQTGTILEAHQVRFFEERNGFMGPLGRLSHGRQYPFSLPPGPNVGRYPDSGEPADKKLEHEVPSLRDLMPMKELPKKDALVPRLGTPSVEPVLSRSRDIER